MMTSDNQAELAQVVMQVLDEWGVAPGDRAMLLGLPEKTPARALSRYRKGTPFADDEETQQRISHLLNIHRLVRTILPHNAAMAAYWITSPNPYFSELTPLEVMLKYGLEGMEQVVGHLNCSGGWG